MQNEDRLSDNVNIAISVPIGISLNGKVEAVRLGINTHHIAITGYAGSGKSTLLHNFICSIIQKYSAKEVQLVLLDSGLCEFRLFEDIAIPNIQMISMSEDPSCFLALFHELNQEITRRENVLMENSIASYSQYTKEYHNVPFSNLILIMDCSCQFLKWLSINTDDFQTILQKGYALNIFVIIAGHSDAVLEYLPESIQRHFETKILMHQGVNSAYRQLGDWIYAEKSQHLHCGEAIVNKPSPHVIRIPHLDQETEKQILSQANT